MTDHCVDPTQSAKVWQIDIQKEPKHGQQYVAAPHEHAFIRDWSRSLRGSDVHIPGKCRKIYIWLLRRSMPSLWTDPDRCVDPTCYKVRIYIATPRGHAFDGTGPDRCMDPTCTSQHKQLNEDTPAHYELSERPTS